MRVVQLIDSLIAGGKERQFCELVRGLRGKADFDVEVVVMSGDVQYSILAEENIPVHTIARRKGASVADFFALARLLRSLEPDLIHSWNSMCSVYAAPVAPFLGAAFVNGFFRNAPTELPLGLRLRTALTVPFSDALVANSRAGIAAYGLPQQRATCIYNGFDGARVSTLPPPDEMRRSLHIATPYVVGMVAAFRPDKDYGSFLDMAASLTALRSDVTVLAVGEGPELSRFREAYPETSFPRIRFLGRRTDAEAVASIMNVGVLASRSEGLSNAIMEYMALAKPVVATDIAGNRELVEDGVTGYLVPSDDPRALERRITELLDDAGLAARLGANGRSVIGTRFTFPAMIEAYADFYRKVVVRRSGALGREQQGGAAITSG